MVRWSYRRGLAEGMHPPVCPKSSSVDPSEMWNGVYLFYNGPSKWLWPEGLILYWTWLFDLIVNAKRKLYEWSWEGGQHSKWQIEDSMAKAFVDEVTYLLVCFGMSEVIKFADVDHTRWLSLTTCDVIVFHFSSAMFDWFFGISIWQ